VCAFLDDMNIIDVGWSWRSVLQQKVYRL